MMKKINEFIFFFLEEKRAADDKMSMKKNKNEE